MDFNIFEKEDRDKTARELMKRVEKGEAFLIWATGMTKKQQKRLEKHAIESLSLKKTHLNLHVIRMDCGKEFRFVE